MYPESSSTPSTPRLPDAPETTGSPWGDRCWRHGRFHPHRRRAVHRVVMGLTVIAWGALLLLRDAGVVNPALHVLDFWPLLLIGFGVSALIRWRDAGAALFGAIVGLAGAGLLAERLGYIQADVVRLWPVLIIAAGVALVLRGSVRHRPLGSVRESVSADVLQRSVTMGNIKLAVDSQQFKGARLGATMGEVQVDLRRAAISGEEATIEVSVVMGGIELFVPSHWQVVSDVSPLMGAVEDKTEFRPDPTGVQKRLVLRGSITMGAVNVRN
jgi:predicted membrane protein